MEKVPTPFFTCTDGVLNNQSRCVTDLNVDEDAFWLNRSNNVYADERMLS